jgi:DNA modification methylase
MRRPILNNSAPGEAMYEPFAGSGTTIIAAEATERRCLAMEVDPRYVDVAVQRWQSLTGRRAVRARTGEPFGAEPGACHGMHDDMPRGDGGHRHA